MRNFFLISLLIVSKLILSQEIVVNVTNIESEEGKIFIRLYDDKESFLKAPIQSKIISVSGQKANYTFTDIKPGIYAVSVYQDVNNNAKLDANFMHIPKEPVGISNNAKPKFGPPKFEDAKFELKPNKRIILNITL